ncbi:signal peptide protein [Paenibacillus tarimensis]|uniref:signal peptide protein n=1 Tax=Paenibacillus tarimensis TaxID=416012 RepID=UPI0038B251D5
MRLLLALIMVLLAAGCGNSQSVFYTGSEPEEALPSTARVPWDYRIVEGKVGDLVGSDITVLPDNEMLPNDANYATGDPVWTLQYMTAELIAGPDNRNDLVLSSWQTIKSFKTEAEAKSDLEELKVSVTTEVDLVGVYKTEYQGATRNFAVLSLPSGHEIKQPVNDGRYAALKDQKTAKVVLEEVHDYIDYDAAYAKFRGWAE